MNWSDWISANETYNWSAKNPLIDWLDAYGTIKGFIADSSRPGYDRRFDYVSFVIKQSWAFKTAVIRWLAAHSPMRTIATNPKQTRELSKQQQTVAAMRAGVPIIAGAILWNSDDRMAGMVDLLVRSDVLARLSPTAFAGESPEAPSIPAPALGLVDYHYRAIDIKFLTLHLLGDGTASAEHLPHMVQNWIYNEALGRTQGYTPPASYLVGRELFRPAARVNHSDPQLRRLAAEASAWILRLRKEGPSWHALPVPSVPELRPNLKASRDQEWHAAKQEIARAQHDLTLLPYVGPEGRALAAASGITQWDDPALSAQVAGLGDSTEGRRLDAVLMANRSSGDQSVFPKRLVTNVANWQRPAPLECFVSLHTVNDQADDFNRVPERAGTALLFMITWGSVDRNGQWQSLQLIARDLSLAAEADLVEAWTAELKNLAERHGVQLQDVRLRHWGNQHLSLPPRLAGGELNWLDLLDNPIRAEPVTVRGAFGFGLAEMARAFKPLGLIGTDLPAVLAGPLEAMAGVWSSAEEAKRSGTALEQVDAMQVIACFSQAACRSMMEILDLLRQRASASLPEAA